MGSFSGILNFISVKRHAAFICLRYNIPLHRLFFKILKEQWYKFIQASNVCILMNNKNVILVVPGFNRCRCSYFNYKPSIPPVETAFCSPANGIKNFYFDGTDSFEMPGSVVGDLIDRSLKIK